MVGAWGYGSAGDVVYAPDTYRPTRYLRARLALAALWFAKMISSYLNRNAVAGARSPFPQSGIWRAPVQGALRIIRAGMEVSL